MIAVPLPRRTAPPNLPEVDRVDRVDRTLRRADGGAPGPFPVSAP